MSVQALRWVLEKSDSAWGERLVLIALAFRANERGDDAWPSVPQIASMAGLSERQVYRILKSLRESGAIVKTGEKSRGTAIFSIAMTPDTMTGDVVTGDRMSPLTNGAKNPDTMSPKRSRTSVVVEANASTPKPRKRDPLWDILAAELGEPKTRSERGRRNAALKELREIGATESELLRRIAVYRKEWPNITLTATALTSNWTALGNGVNGHVSEAAKKARAEAQMREIYARQRAADERRQHEATQ